MEALLTEKDGLDADISIKEGKLEACKDKIVDYHRRVGSLEQKVINIKDQKNDYLELREQFAAYDLYMRAMHPNGIAYDVIKKKLPVINKR